MRETTGEEEKGRPKIMSYWCVDEGECHRESVSVPAYREIHDDHRRFAFGKDFRQQFTPRRSSLLVSKCSYSQQDILIYMPFTQTADRWHQIPWRPAPSQQHRGP